MEQDIGEQTDLAGQYPEKAAELAKLHEAWKSRHYPNPLRRRSERNLYAFPVRPPVP